MWRQCYLAGGYFCTMSSLSQRALLGPAERISVLVAESNRTHVEGLLDEVTTVEVDATVCNGSTTLSIHAALAPPLSV